MDSENNAAIFEINTVNRKRAFSDFMYFENLVHGKRSLCLTIFAITLYVLMGVFLLCSPRPIPIIFFWIFVMLIAIPSTLQGHTRGKYIGEKHIASEYVDRYLFYSDCFLVFDQGTQLTVNYSTLKEAYETKGYFYLYNEHDKAHIIEKNGFITGTPKEMRLLLREKLSDRFHIKKKGSCWYEHNR